MYSREYIDDKTTQISCVLAIAQRVATKIRPSFVTSPQGTLRVPYRRQASLVQILAGNAGRNYF